MILVIKFKDNQVCNNERLLAFLTRTSLLNIIVVELYLQLVLTKCVDDDEGMPIIINLV